MQIFRYLWYYSFWLYVRTCLHFYYKRIKVVGYDKVPKGVPIIFGANHQNALVDPLLMTTHIYQMTHYLVRADVFKNPIVRRFLNSLNLMPVYRARDGVNSIKANQQIFKACFDAFKVGESLMLFPEGTHDDRWVEKPMKKGIARIALGGLSQPDSVKELYIVPIGLTYSGMKSFRSSMVLHYGEPIKVEKQEEIAENIDRLKNQFESSLKHYHAALPEKGYDYLEKVFFHNQDGKTLIEDYQTINEQSRIIDERATDEEKQEILTLSKELEKGGLKFPFPKRKSPILNALFAALLSPLALVGFILNLPILFVPWKIMKGIKDKVFVDTIYFGVGLVGFPTLWLIYAGIAYSQTSMWQYALGALIASPLSLLAFGRFRYEWDIYQRNAAFNRSEQLKQTYDKFLKSIEHLKAYTS
ncbi:lysophospholipid acyltransferase family protein [Reichenbachiella ulvae]|uniref:Lysophospholipid acyltransferase family protein n=1 Tax=Reichenbachiella ulvae TaxID=2980104 RepID=A0ABT3D0C3_9BACT|nr:lysophospholipid acyltransferase family protein [Reichenbachiella ulvae]MCV9389209.1 lysophospholipid acyltransferase family protein [Reichenbachiella ulvae]